MRWFALFIIIMAACAPVTQERFVTFTPGSTTTTPTQEMIWTAVPGNGLDHEPPIPFIPLNHNYDLYNNEVVSIVPDPDGVNRRYQCEPAAVVMDISFPNPESPRVAPFVNCDMDNSDGGILRVNITQVDGVYQWRFPMVMFPAGYCYLAKVTGSSDFVGNDLENIGFVAGVETLDSRQLYTARQSIPRHAGFELVWAIRAETIDNVNFLMQLEIDWATFVGVVNIDTMEFMNVPESYCDSNSPVW